MVAGAFLAAATFAASSVKAADYNSGIWRVMREGHFGGRMRRHACVLRIKGDITANGTHYRFWEYGYDSIHSGQSHSALLVFEKGAHGLSYLGCYVMDPLEDFKGPVHPVIQGKSVFFPFHTYEILGHKQSFAISFENGPPEKIGISEFQR